MSTLRSLRGLNVCGYPRLLRLRVWQGKAPRDYESQSDMGSFFGLFGHSSNG